MRRTLLCLIAACLATPPVLPGHAATPPPPANNVPHAWLFGSWTGGLFPVPAAMTAQACLAQPVVIFTRDLVLRATLIDQVYTQRAIETVRVVPGTTDFRFAPSLDPAADLGSGLMGATAPHAPVGFGCADPDSLHVVRRSDNEIVFEGCADFPEPLIRCPNR